MSFWTVKVASCSCALSSAAVSVGGAVASLEWYSQSSIQVTYVLRTYLRCEVVKREKLIRIRLLNAVVYACDQLQILMEQ